MLLMSAAAVRTRTGTEADLASIMPLLAASALPLDGVNAAAVASGAIRFIVAEHRGRVVGVGALEPCGNTGRYALLRSLAIDARLRRGGIGRAVVRQLIDEARTSGVSELYLLTTTAADYFPKFGFEPIARDTVPAEVRMNVEFTTACPATATAMRLALSREVTAG
jgi:amino-acid N-acetyltransferase